MPELLHHSSVKNSMGKMMNVVAVAMAAIAWGAFRASPASARAQLAYTYVELSPDSADTYAIRTINADGSGRKTIYRCITGDDQTSPCPVGDLAWSPDGSRFALQATDRLGLVNADGSGFTTERKVTQADGEPAWSPDGKQLVFSGGGVLAESRDLYILDVASSRVRRLTYRGGLTPTWSPTGKQIAYLRPAGRKLELTVVKPNGSSRRRLTWRGASSPAWSPHGRELLFARNGACTVKGCAAGKLLRLAIRPGSRARQVSAAGDAFYATSWGSDGRIAYVAEDRESRQSGYVQALDGSRRRRLLKPRLSFGERIADLTWRVDR